jgi:hypothetical protein
MTKAKEQNATSNEVMDEAVWLTHPPGRGDVARIGGPDVVVKFC